MINFSDSHEGKSQESEVNYLPRIYLTTDFTDYTDLAPLKRRGGCTSLRGANDSVAHQRILHTLCVYEIIKEASSLDCLEEKFAESRSYTLALTKQYLKHD